MTWAEIKRTLTTPPPPRPPPPKAPLFTTDFFSTKSFGPGHIVGAGMLALGIFGLTKFAISRADAHRLAGPRLPRRPEDDPQIARANARGQYGNNP